jgi:osmotically-inducible protein OsmY
MKDKALSSYAHNVKVIAQGGQVTLKGPVRSDDEKRAVEAQATEVAGAGHVAKVNRERQESRSELKASQDVSLLSVVYRA